MRNHKEVIKNILHSAEIKTDRKFYNSFIKAIMAGIFISFGAFGNILISADMFSSNQGVARFLGAVVFPVGLIGIVILGLELFTSNCMNILGVVHKKVSVKNFLRNIIIVYIGNFIGCSILGYITASSHGLTNSGVELLQNMVHHKVHTGIWALFLKGIMCNVLVVGATIFAYFAKDAIGKIMGIWFPIMLFILLGYSHSVANMYYFMTAVFYNLDITILGILYNLLFVTIGNFVGGSLLTLILNIDRNLD